ncbi:hypothetical protein BDW74DRAFT_172867 [Aspergillus multicolor]|uniref:uncharacterized protein n=1 Tax=Aspergillus multicolor TaxID=41759 RepID=UPI003CCD3E38
MPANCTWPTEEKKRLVVLRKECPNMPWAQFVEFPFPGRTLHAVQAKWFDIAKTENLKERQAIRRKPRKRTKAKTAASANNDPTWSINKQYLRSRPRRVSKAQKTRHREESDEDGTASDDEVEPVDETGADAGSAEEADDDMPDANALGANGDEGMMPTRRPRNASGLTQGSRTELVTKAHVVSRSTPSTFGPAQQAATTQQRPSDFLAQSFFNIYECYASKVDDSSRVERLETKTAQHDGKMDEVEGVYRDAIKQLGKLEDVIKGLQSAAAYKDSIIKGLQSTVQSQDVAIKTLAENVASNHANMRQLLQYIGEFSVANRVSLGGQVSKNNDSPAPSTN